MNSAAYGLDNAINSIVFTLKELDAVPIDIIFVTEGKDSLARRKTFLPTYKSGRSSRCPAQYEAFNACKDQLLETFRNLGSQVATCNGCEADDTLTYLAQRLPGEIVVLTEDGDLSALINERVSLFQNGRVKLTNASVPWDGNITFLCQPSYLAYLEQTPEFVNAQLVDVKPYAGGDSNPSWRDKPQAYRWRNALIIEHPNLPGKATTSEKSFLYHKTAIGQAADTGGMATPVGYNEEQDYSWARASCFMGAKLLQNTGVVVFTTDGSAYA